MSHPCKICGNIEVNRQYSVREMAFGMRETFPYFECDRCGCLQLLEIPKDIARYYPPDYYSFQHHGALMTFLRHQWSAQAFHGGNPIGWLLSAWMFPNDAIRAVRRAKIPCGTRILDVGCGSGRLLLDLAYLGYSNLQGADPFITSDLAYPNGVRVFKRQLTEMPGPFDLVMMHHSFEHMDSPGDVMRNLARLMAPGGQAIIRIPVASSYAWKRYGVNWVNLDAPRHFFLHTFKSIDLLAEHAGLVVSDTVHEGNGEQFWGSEQFENDISSNDPRSVGFSQSNRVKAWRRIRACKAQAQELNDRREGDLVCFHLRKAQPI